MRILHRSVLFRKTGFLYLRTLQEPNHSLGLLRFRRRALDILRRKREVLRAVLRRGQVAVMQVEHVQATIPQSVALRPNEPGRNWCIPGGFARK